jgi:hypothetical protein
VKRAAPTVAVLAHPADGFWDEARLVHLLMARWEAAGWRTRLVTDPANPGTADVAILHVSLSVVPEAFRRLSARYPRTINGSVLDIRKRRFSRLLVDREGPDPGPVIVKTDANAGGWRELRGAFLETAAGRRVARLDPRARLYRHALRLESLRPWSARRVPRIRGYTVYPSRDQVPEGVWRNPHLVVERLVAERMGDRYLCRHWLFFGSREVTRRTVSPEPVVKFRGVMERTSEPVPDELRRIREEMGFDYGKFDYGVVDGEVVLYDVNRTPGAAADPRVHARTVDALSSGLGDFLP